jgi:hypothetical protein
MKKIKQIMYGGTDSKGHYSTIIALTEDGRLWSSGEVCLFRESDYKNIHWREIPTPTSDGDRKKAPEVNVTGNIEVDGEILAYTQNNLG